MMAEPLSSLTMGLGRDRVRWQIQRGSWLIPHPGESGPHHYRGHSSVIGHESGGNHVGTILQESLALCLSSEQGRWWVLFCTTFSRIF